MFFFPSRSPLEPCPLSHEAQGKSCLYSMLPERGDISRGSLGKCCQCGSVANPHVASFQSGHAPSPIGNWNWNWQHSRTGNTFPSPLAPSAPPLLRFLRVKNLTSPLSSLTPPHPLCLSLCPLRPKSLFPLRASVSSCLCVIQNSLVVWWFFSSAPPRLRVSFSFPPLSPLWLPCPSVFFAFSAPSLRATLAPMTAFHKNPMAFRPRRAAGGAR